MEIKEILEKLEKHELDVESAMSFIEHQDFCLDFDRKQRTGAPEVIYGAGKTAQ